MSISTAKGTLVKLASLASPTNFKTVAQVRSISGPSVKPHIVDVTTHDTPGNWRRKIHVLNDPGDLSFEINFDHLDATHAFTTGMWNIMINLALQNVQIVMPNTSGTLAAQGYVNSHEFMLPVDNLIGARLGLSLTDAITAT